MKHTNPRQLAARTGLHRDRVIATLDEYGLKPLAEMPYGRGTIRIYDEDAAMDVLRQAYELDGGGEDEVQAEYGKRLGALEDLVKLQSTLLKDLLLALGPLEEQRTQFETRSLERDRTIFKQLETLVAQVGDLHAGLMGEKL